MTDHLPSKELPKALPAASYDGELWVRAADVQLLLTERAQLRTTLTGISTCSTCEACRGAALRALGERTVAEINAAVDERLDRVERELAEAYDTIINRALPPLSTTQICPACGHQSQAQTAPTPPGAGE